MLASFVLVGLLYSITTVRDPPAFDKPTKGFEPRGTPFADKLNAWRQLFAYPLHRTCGDCDWEDENERPERRRLFERNWSATPRVPGAPSSRQLYDREIGEGAYEEPDVRCDEGHPEYQQHRLWCTTHRCNNAFALEARPNFGIVLGHPEEKDGNIGDFGKLSQLCNFGNTVTELGAYQEGCWKKGRSPGEGPCCPVLTLPHLMVMIHMEMNPQQYWARQPTAQDSGVWNAEAEPAVEDPSRLCGLFTSEVLEAVKPRIAECGALIWGGNCGRIFADLRCEDEVVRARCNQRINSYVRGIYAIMADSQWLGGPTNGAVGNGKLTYAQAVLPIDGAMTLEVYQGVIEEELIDWQGENSEENLRIVGVMLRDKGMLFNVGLTQGLTWAICAVVLIGILNLVHTRSLHIAGLSMLQIIFSLLFAMFLFMIVLWMPYFSFLNMNMLFVGVAIGVDDVFVFVDCYKQSYRMLPKDTEVPSRLAWTFRRAFGAMLVTTLTTAMAFIANLVSPITAVKGFSVYSCLVIVADFGLMLTILPCIVVYSEFGFWQRRCDCGWNKAASVKAEQMEGDERPEPRRIEFAFQHYITPSIIKGRWIIAVVFTGFGVFCLTQALTLKRSTSQNMQLFVTGHMVEEYDQDLYKKFRFESERKSAGGGMRISIVAGTKPSDKGNHFDPDDFGEIEWADGRVLSEASQVYFRDLCLDFQSAPRFRRYSTMNHCAYMLLQEHLEATCWNDNSRHNIFEFKGRDLSSWTLADSDDVALVENIPAGTRNMTVVSLNGREEELFRLHCSDGQSAIMLQERYAHAVSQDLCQATLAQAKQLKGSRNANEQELRGFPKVGDGNFRCCGHSFPASEDVATKCMYLIMESLRRGQGLDNMHSNRFNAIADGRYGFIVTGGFGDALKAAVIGYETTTAQSDDVELLGKVQDDVNKWADQALKNPPGGVPEPWWHADLNFWDLQTAMSEGARDSVIVALLCCLVTMLLVVGNVIMAIYALISIVWILSCVLATLIWAGWVLDLMTSIILAIACGMCVDFVCHIAHGYVHAHAEDPTSRHDERVQRTTLAMSTMGITVMTGALTTLCGGLLMLPSPVKFFFQFGQFMAVTMLWAFIYAALYFPALCAIMGVVGKWGDIGYAIRRLLGRDGDKGGTTGGSCLKKDDAKAIEIGVKTENSPRH